MTAPGSTSEWRVFGLSVAEVSVLLSAGAPSVPMEEHEDGSLSVFVPPEQAEVAGRALGVHVYSRQGETLAQRVVSLLQQHGKTVATAESCTGGLIAAALTGVPGSSAVIGTGVVSYSFDCKEKLLAVSPDTLTRHGVVSVPVAGEMARGVRRLSGADIGVSVTGEAGPSAGSDQPVGTVCVALADGRRTWSRRLDLSGAGDRSGIRRRATAQVLDLCRRYLEAYPAVMAGGESHSHRPSAAVSPRGGGSLVGHLFPRRGEPLRRVLFKCGAWLLALALLCVSLWLGYLYLLAPGANRQLQASLGDLYWGYTVADGVEDSRAEAYPPGMMATFRGLYDRNPDVVGWLRVADTAIDYPVMAYADGFYRNHSFDGQYSLFGQPHLGASGEVSAEGTSSVLTIYGRNTGNGQMFSSLTDYRRLAYLRGHGVLEFNTLYDTAYYEVFAVMLVDADAPEEFVYDRTVFSSQEDLAAYIADLQAHSLYRTDGEITPQDRLLLLSTDADRLYGFDGARLVVAARRLTDRDTITTYHVNNEVILPASWLAIQRPAAVSTTAPRRTTVLRATTATTRVAEDDVQPTGSTTAAEQTGTSATPSTTVSTTVPTLSGEEDETVTTATTVSSAHTTQPENRLMETN